MRNNLYIFIGKLLALGSFGFRRKLICKTLTFLITNPIIIKVCYSNFVSIEVKDVTLADSSYD